MILRTCLLTKNDCYKSAQCITPKGVMVHSTGANNPNVKRYVQPNDGKLGVNYGGNDWNRSGIGACVHAFIGKTDAGEIATYQTLPWTMRGWHGGGSSNNTHISFEICEDGLSDSTYFNKVYTEAVELTAHLCKQYKLNPLSDGVVICHSEGYKRGIATNHADVMHWFPKHGKSMDSFRTDVNNLLRKPEVEDLTKAETTALIKELVPSMVKDILEGKDTVASGWAKEELSAAIAMGITDGDRPGGYAKREEAAIMTMRAMK